MNSCSKKKTHNRVGLNLKGYKSHNCFVLSCFFIFTQLAIRLFEEREEKKLGLFHNMSETSQNKINMRNGCIPKDKVNQGFNAVSKQTLIALGFTY